MGTYIIRRILIAIPVLIGITVVSFVALSLARALTAASLTLGLRLTRSGDS